MGNPGLYRNMTPLERFEARRTIDENGCWVIRGGTRYVSIMVDGKQRLAHRWAYEHFVGPIPDGHEIDHLCKNTRCSNPEHLEAVTRRENIRRSDNYLGVNMRKDRCPQGHEYTHTAVTKDGRTNRKCRHCEREAERRYEVKRKARRKAAHTAPLETPRIG